MEHLTNLLQTSTIASYDVQESLPELIHPPIHTSNVRGPFLHPVAPRLITIPGPEKTFFSYKADNVYVFALQILPDNVFSLVCTSARFHVYIFFRILFFIPFGRDSHKAPRTWDIVYLLPTPQSLRDVLSPFYALAKH